MKNLKSNLTKLETKVAAQIPTGDDVFDFKGISREMVLNEIGKIKKILDNLENQGEINFEIIALKRMSSKLHEKLNELADKGFEDKEIFNEFLTTLSTLSDKTLLTYFMVNKNGLRTDEELINIKAKIQENKTELESILGLCNKYSSLPKDLADIQENITYIAESANKIKETSVTIEKEKNELINSTLKVKEKNRESIGIGKNISDISTKISEVNKNSEYLSKRCSTLLSEVEDLQTKSKKNEELSAKTLNESNKILEGATRVGLAQSFSIRKNELTMAQLAWQVLFILSIIAITYLLFKTSEAFPIDLLNPTSYLNLIPKTLIVGPSLWLAWFSSKQYSILDKIKEDYAFKYALSMAYDGYKKAIENVADKENKELTKRLLSNMLDSLSFNPISLFSKEEICTPVESILNGKNIKATIDSEKGASVEIAKE